MNTRRTGAVAALLAGCGDLAILYVFLVVLPRAGLTSPDDFANPAKVATVSGALRLLSVLQIVFAAAGIPTLRALDERMRGSAPRLMRLALVAVTIASVLFLAAGVLGLAGRPFGDPLLDALGGGAVFAFGVAVIAAGWAALVTRTLPRGLAYLSLGAGALGILSFLHPLIQLLEVVAFIAWTGWLAAVLLRTPGREHGTVGVAAPGLRS